MQPRLNDIHSYIEFRTAGLFSTSHDLCKFIRGIFQNKLLGATPTRTWLKPRTFTSSLYNFAGAPWEIYRPTFLTPEPRPIDHYTKEGDVSQNGYAAVIILVPEYNLGVSIVVGGDDAYDATLVLLNTVQAYMVPLMESLARNQAAEKYARRYVSKDPANHAALELVVDGGPGLSISHWTNLGKDMLASVESILFHGNGDGIDARIYPEEQEDKWRVTFEEPGEGGPLTVLSTSCRTWEQVDQLRYAQLPTDEFDFEVTNGRVTHVTIPGLRTTLVKV
jgi:hypothetical protein